MIADTGPINYLLPTGHIEILPALFDEIIVPAAVRDELRDRRAPGAVRDWMAATPAWLEVRDIAAPLSSPDLAALGPGERSAIELAIEMGADLVLMDDRKGVAAGAGGNPEIRHCDPSLWRIRRRRHCACGGRPETGTGDSVA